MKTGIGLWKIPPYFLCFTISEMKFKSIHQMKCNRVSFVFFVSAGEVKMIEIETLKRIHYLIVSSRNG